MKIETLLLTTLALSTGFFIGAIAICHAVVINEQQKKSDYEIASKYLETQLHQLKQLRQQENQQNNTPNTPNSDLLCKMEGEEEEEITVEPD